MLINYTLLVKSKHFRPYVVTTNLFVSPRPTKRAIAQEYLRKFIFLCRRQPFFEMILKLLIHWLPQPGSPAFSSSMYIDWSPAGLNQVYSSNVDFT